MRYFRLFLIVVLLAAVSYFLSLNLFLGLKIKGYSYLFYASQPYDLVIKHAQILDGTGVNEKFRGDIAIRDGKIVGVGYVNPEDSPVFDAGGLTVIPIPLPVTKNAETVEHLLSTSYPRYPAQEIYLQEGLHQGLNLEQAARALGMDVDKAFHILRSSRDVNPKVLIAEIPYQEDKTTLQEYLARLTGYRASYYNLPGQGVLQTGANADIHLFNSREYPDEKLEQLLKQGQVPPPVYIVKEGKFLNQ